MKDEPNIVKELREAEKLGILQSKVQSEYEQLEVPEEESSEDVPDETVSFVEEDLDEKTRVDDTNYENTGKMLLGAEDRYRLIIENTSDLIALVTFTLNPTYTYVNPSYKKVLGYDPEDLICKPGLDFVHPDDKKILLSLSKKYISAKAKKLLTRKGLGISEVVEYRIRDKSGNWHYMDGTANFVGNEVLLISKDITERKKTEEKLRESEDKYRDLFENANDIIQAVKPDGSFLNVNRAWKKALGYNEKEIEGLSVFDIIHPNSKEHCMKIFKRIMSGENIEHVEASFLTRDGREINVEGNINCRFEEGKPVSTRGIFRDITERKRTEAVLRESEEKYRTLVENADDCIFLIDETLKVLSLNTSAARIFGKKTEGVVGESILELFPKEIASGYSENLKKVFKTGKRHKSETKLIVGEIDMWISANLNPVKDHNGKVVAVLGVTRDITERKQTEEKIQHQNEFLNNVMESLTHPFYVIDANDYSIKMANAVTGRGNLSENPTTCYKLTHKRSKPCENAEHFCPLKRVKKTKKPVIVEHTHYDKDGNARVFEVHGYPIFDDDVNVVQMIEYSLDITERKKAEGELKKAHDKLRELNENLERKVEERTTEVHKLLKQKDEFINQLGHDLKTPLTPLVSLLPILEETEKDPKSKELFEILHRSVDRVKNLVAKTLELARLNAPSTVFDMKDLNLWEAAENSIKDQQLLWDEKEVRIENLIDENIFVIADKLRLDEVFVNLINNAIKYGPIDGTITVDAHDKGDLVTVSIKDSGAGITAEQIDRIFDEFYKADESRHDFDSSGLGLSICKRIVEKHEGRIWAESLGPNKGSTFYFTIPIGSKISKENVSEQIDMVIKNVKKRIGER